VFSKKFMFGALLLVLVAIAVACAPAPEPTKAPPPPPPPTTAPTAAPVAAAPTTAPVATAAPKPTEPPKPTEAPKPTDVPKPTTAPTADPYKGITAAQDAWAKAAELGPYAPQTQDWTAIEAAAKKEGKVVIYSNSSRWPDIKKTFEAQYPGVIVEGYDISTVDLITKLQKEQKAGIFNADVILCGDYATLVREMLYPPNKMLWNFVPQELEPLVDLAAREPLMYHRYGLTAFVYNAEVYKEPPVKNIWDFTKPEWKGKIVMPDPQKVAMGLLALTVITKNGDVMAQEYQKAFGKPIVLESGVPNAGYQWIKDVLKNDPALTSSSGDAANAIGAKGQKAPPIGFTTYSKIRDVIAGTLTFDVMWNMSPIIGFTEETALAIANQAPHPNAAKLLIRWMEGDDKGSRGFTPFYVPGDYPTRKDVPPPKGAKPWADVQKFVWSGAGDIDYTYNNAIKVRDFWLANLGKK
jgi:iron(III) transport system substrate-binding protein